MEDITEKFRSLYAKIASPVFLSREAIGGEVPFFISAYDARQEIEVQANIPLLKNKLSTAGIPVVELNLYDIVCELLEARGGMSVIFDIEAARTKEKFQRALRSALNIHERLIPAIADRISAAEAQVYFLTGVGLVFPYIRSHTVLNNLQSIARDAPTVIFFPGTYNGQALNLFGLLKDDNYYRAFDINNIQA